ncbi:MAG: RNA polymerase sigma factor [Patescibacteria group bacterium]
MKILIDKILEGDSHAVVKLYNFYSPKISKYLERKLPKEEASEILNDVFLEAIDSLQILKNQDNLFPWLYRVARNKTVDHYRKQKLKSILFSQIPFLKILESEINDPEFQFEKNKTRDKVESTYLSLSANYQKILRLYYENNLSIKEIAFKINLSFKATESLFYRARQSFKIAYNSDFIEE